MCSHTCMPYQPQTMWQASASTKQPSLYQSCINCRSSYDSSMMYNIINSSTTCLNMKLYRMPNTYNKKSNKYASNNTSQDMSMELTYVLDRYYNISSSKPFTTTSTKHNQHYSLTKNASIYTLGLVLCIQERHKAYAPTLNHILSPYIHQTHIETWNLNKTISDPA